MNIRSGGPSTHATPSFSTKASLNAVSFIDSHATTVLSCPVRGTVLAVPVQNAKHGLMSHPDPRHDENVFSLSRNRKETSGVCPILYPRKLMIGYYATLCIIERCGNVSQGVQSITKEPPRSLQVSCMKKNEESRLNSALGTEDV
jgi:hypothetical protein